MESVGTIVPRIMNGIAAVARPSDASDGPAVRRPRSLRDLRADFLASEATENPDVVVPLSSLRATEAGHVKVPQVGTLAWTEWSRGQAAALLGIRFDRWFENARPAERADELNRRFARATGEVRLRSSHDVQEDADGVLRAIVTPSYTPVRDALLASLLIESLEGAEPDLAIVRADVTDRSVSYVVRVGRSFRPGDSHEVGDIWGGLLVRNSGVGYASLAISLHLTRLLCKNGMTAPLPDALVMRKRHRSLDEGILREGIARQLDGLPGKLARAGETLRAARERTVVDVEATVREVLQGHRLPQRNLEPIMTAWSREPERSHFGVAQAITLAAQWQTPEVRYDLEQAAGAFLASGGVA